MEKKRRPEIGGQGWGGEEGGGEGEEDEMRSERRWGQRPRGEEREEWGEKERQGGCDTSVSTTVMSTCARSHCTPATLP